MSDQNNRADDLRAEIKATLDYAATQGLCDAILEQFPDGCTCDATTGELRPLTVEERVWGGNSRASVVLSEPGELCAPRIDGLDQLSEEELEAVLDAAKTSIGAVLGEEAVLDTDNPPKTVGDE